MRNIAIALAAVLALTVYGCGKKEEAAAPAVEQTTTAPATTEGQAAATEGQAAATTEGQAAATTEGQAAATATESK